MKSTVDTQVTVATHVTGKDGDGDWVLYSIYDSKEAADAAIAKDAAEGKPAPLEII